MALARPPKFDGISLDKTGILISLHLLMIPRTSQIQFLCESWLWPILLFQSPRQANQVRMSQGPLHMLEFGSGYEFSSISFHFCLIASFLS